MIVSPLTKLQTRAMRLLARGGARYGTMHATMLGLKDLGLAYVYDTGKIGHGRWTWRPTKLCKTLTEVEGGE